MKKEVKSQPNLLSFILIYINYLFFLGLSFLSYNSVFNMLSGISLRVSVIDICIGKFGRKYKINQFNKII